MTARREPIDLAVVLPVGPRDDGADTLDSVFTHVGARSVAVVVDDTGSASRARDMRAVDPDRVVVLPATGPSGKGGRLWQRDCTGFSHLLEHFDPAVVLRLDADALVVGPRPEAAARARFDQDPSLGSLGSFERACTGEQRDFGPAARGFRRHLRPRALAGSSGSRAVARIVVPARRHGWPWGGHALGAGLFLTGGCLREMHERRWLDPHGPLVGEDLEDDWLLGAMTFAVGMRIGSFTGPGEPVGVAWRGLPAHPQALLDDGRSVVHSVRSFGALDERVIRAGFRDVRRGRTPSWLPSASTGSDHDEAMT